MEVPVVQVYGGVVCGAVWGTRIVLNREAPLPVGGEKKHFEMGERFVSRRPLVPLLTISRKNSCVENELVHIVYNLLGRVGRGAGVIVHDYVIDLMPYYLDVIGGGVCLTEELDLHEPVRVGDNGVGLIYVVKQIQCDGSAVPSARPVLDPDKFFLNSAHKLLSEGAVHIMKRVERECYHIV